MRAASQMFLDLLASGQTNMCRLWTLTLSTGVVLYLTDNSNDLWFDGVNHEANPGIEISAIRNSVADGLQDATVTIALSGDITEEMVRYNELSRATFSIHLVHYLVPAAGRMYVFGGTIREAELTDRGRVELSVEGSGGPVAEVSIGEVYSERCRNIIGDRRCKVDLKKYEVPFVVTEVEPDGSFKTSVRVPTAGYTNLDLNSVQVTTYYTGEPGAADIVGNFVVPQCAQLTVSLVGGGGGAGGDARGPDGRPSSFGDTSAAGGIGVDKRTTPPDLDRSTDTGIFGGAGTGGFRYFGIAEFVKMNTFAGNGQRTVRKYSVGPGKDLEVGQVVQYRAGGGGFVVDDTAADDHPSGWNGSVTITTRGVVATMDGTEFNFGKVIWTGGANTGRQHSITGIVDEAITLAFNGARPVAVGDQGTLQPGCSNYRSMCVGKYDNLRNMHAEPDVPNIKSAPSATVVDTGKPPPLPNGGGLSMSFPKA